MPRVAIKKKDYMISDLSQWISGRMYVKKLRQKDMAQLIGITQPSFCRKLESGFFSYGELLSILKKLDATDEEILRLMKL